MARKKKQTTTTSYKFDTSIKYIMPMLPVGERNRVYQNEVPNIHCTITQNERDAVKASAEGYQDKWFEGQYFDWLLYTGYVKKDTNKVTK